VSVRQRERASERASERARERERERERERDERHKGSDEGKGTIGKKYVKRDRRTALEGVTRRIHGNPKHPFSSGADNDGAR